MDVKKIIGVMLIAAGTLALVYGEFSYTKERHGAKLGALELSVDEKQTVRVPVWIGGGVIAIGTVLLLLGRKR